MKKVLGLILVILFILTKPSLCISQNRPLSFFINEISVSMNQTTVKNDNTSNRFGFGLELHKSWMDSSWFNLLAGISYYRTSQFKKHVYNGHFSNIHDVTYNLHSLSFPAIARFNIGKSTRFFFESGVFLELNVGANREGTFLSTYGGDFKETLRKEKVGIPGLNGGFLVGIGSSIPINAYAIIIKIGYQSAFRDLGSIQEVLVNKYAKISIGIRKNNSITKSAQLK